MKKQTHKKITIYMSENLINEIESRAKALDRSRSWIIEKWVWDAIKAEHDPTA